MSLGNLKNDWVKAVDPKDHVLNTQSKIEKLKVEMISNMPAFQYYNAGNRVVYTKKSTTVTGADFLIECGSDFANVVPNGAKFRAFKNGNPRAVGFVSVNNATGALSLMDTSQADVPVVRAGLTYEHVDTYNSKEVYARLDRTAITQLQSGRHITEANMRAYETSMRKGVIPSGSTGSDGIKFDNNTWVIKLTISIATVQQLDNSLSPMATEYQEGGKIFLNFNQLTMRH
jgi:hypothetical protein